MKRFLAALLACLISFSAPAQVGGPIIGQGGCTVNCTFTGTTTIPNAAITGGTIGTGVSGLPTLLAQSYAAVSAPNDTTEDTLATITVPANTLGANGSLRIYTLWTVTNSATAKTLRIRYSGGSGTIYMQAAAVNQASHQALLVIANQAATNSQIGTAPSTNGGLGVNGSALATSSVDTTASTTIVITGQKATGTDTLTLNGYTVEVIK